jgi:hypothetical protein
MKLIRKGTRSVVVALSLLTLMWAPLAIAKEPEPNWIQNIVIRANEFAVDTHKGLKNTGIQKKIDSLVPLDDFRITIDPINIAVGFSFTF